MIMHGNCDTDSESGSCRELPSFSLFLPEPMWGMYPLARDSRTNDGCAMILVTIVSGRRFHFPILPLFMVILIFLVNRVPVLVLAKMSKVPNSGMGYCLF